MPFHTANDTVNFAEGYDGYLVGTVTANVDPLGLGRVQAQVPGLYDPQQGEIPWIAPHDRQSPFGYGTSAEGPYGVYGVPPIGAKIKIELQGGDVHKPLYSPLHAKADTNSRFSTPNVWGYQDPDGNYMLYDIVAHTYLFVTRTGASIEIDATGKRITTVNGDAETSNGDWTVNVTGNARITSSADTSVNASGNVLVKATGSTTVQGATVNVTASGTATYTALAHVFNGPITTNSTLATAGDITDSTGTGNTRTMANMRLVFDEHRHHYDDNGNDNITDVPFPLT
jgi:hypothetical protein